MNLRKILPIFMLVSIFLPSAFACINPIIKNEFGVPINYMGGGFLFINGTSYDTPDDYYPYPIEIENTNEEKLIVNIAPSGGLGSYIIKVEEEVNPGEKKVVDMMTLISGSNKAGQLYVSGRCEGEFAFAEGFANVYIIGRNTGGETCDGTPTSCGIYPNCQDITDWDGCENGYYRNYYCSGNRPEYSEYCTNYCCRFAHGDEAHCGNGACNYEGSEPETIDFSLSVTNTTHDIPLNVSMFQHGETSPFHDSELSGLGSLSTEFEMVDLGLKHDNSALQVLFENLNTTSIKDQTVSFSIMEVNPDILAVDVLRSYNVEIPEDLVFEIIELRIRYDDLGYTNSDNLRIYKCSDFNTTSNLCNVGWYGFNPSKIGEYLVINIDSFSTYSVIEDNTITTTTTTTPTTTTSPASTTTRPTGSSGGSSGGGSGGSSGGSGGSSRTTTTTTTSVTTTPSEPVTTVTIVTTETTVPANNTTILEDNGNKDEKENIFMITGNFVVDTVSRFWHWIVGLLVLVIVAFVGLMIYRNREKIMISREFGDSVAASPVNHGKNNNYVVLQPEKSEAKPLQVAEDKQQPKKVEVKEADDLLDARSKVIDEIRRRAMEMDGK